ncbi:MAG TPA: T9SS type A sorting domain-containing protein, partial [bacterium]|nr:T9SS type A sorting domain-containing protein [bacterium]
CMSGVDEIEVPIAFSLGQNYPNPFNPTTTIEFTLPASGFTSLIIYNVMGQKVRELVADRMQAGIHSVLWDGKDDNGNVVSSGIYLSRLISGENVAAGRMLLLK